jgi:hypothetical protein
VVLELCPPHNLTVAEVGVVLVLLVLAPFLFRVWHLFVFTAAALLVVAVVAAALRFRRPLCQIFGLRPNEVC